MGIDVKALNLQELLKKELTRKQFLQVLGVMIISVFGFSNLLNLLTQAGKAPTTEKSDSDKNGFGASKFGA